MNKKEAMEKGIEFAIADAIRNPIPIGTIIAHKDHPLACTLVEYDGDIAVGDDTNELKRFPRNEIFSPRKVINIANHLINVGFWAEGMESSIVTI